MSSSGKIGTHTYSVEQDTLYIVNHGPFDAEEACSFLAIYQQVYDRHDYLLIMLDLRDSGPASPEARRALVDWAKTRANTVALAAISGSTVARTTLTLIFSAMRVLSRQVPQLGFFATEAEARDWLVRQRPRLRSHAKHQGRLEPSGTGSVNR